MTTRANFSNFKQQPEIVSTLPSNVSLTGWRCSGQLRNLIFSSASVRTRCRTRSTTSSLSKQMLDPMMETPLQKACSNSLPSRTECVCPASLISLRARTISVSALFRASRKLVRECHRSLPDASPVSSR